MNDKPIVRADKRGQTLEITLDRPPVNAINAATSQAIYDAFRSLQDDPELTVGIITGTGERVFSAGWDLKEVATGSDGIGTNHPHGPGGFAGITEFWDLLKPTIAAVNGAAVGGGLELAISCDIIVMAESAYFSAPEMQRGFLADAGAVQRLPRMLPLNVAKEMLLTGRRMYADEALKWGLVHKVVPQDRLMDQCRDLADEIANGAPLALQALKEVMLHVPTMPLDEAMQINKPGNRESYPMYLKMSKSEDVHEGPRAFAEKRKPVWKRT